MISAAELQCLKDNFIVGGVQNAYCIDVIEQSRVETNQAKLCISRFGGCDAGDYHEFLLETVAVNLPNLTAVNGLVMLSDVSHIARYIENKIDGTCDCLICGEKDGEPEEVEDDE